MKADHAIYGLIPVLEALRSGQRPLQHDVVEEAESMGDLVAGAPGKLSLLQKPGDVLADLFVVDLVG